MVRSGLDRCRLRDRFRAIPMHFAAAGGPSRASNQGDSPNGFRDAQGEPGSGRPVRGNCGPAHESVCPLLSENALIGKPVLLPVDNLRTLIVACDDLDLCSLLDYHTTLPASTGRSTTFVVEARHRALMRLGPGRAETHVF